MLRAGLAALILAAVLAGCGGGNEETTADPGPAAAGGGGLLAFAIPAIPQRLDPLAAAGPEAQLVTRQIHEPLVAEMSGPYDDRSRQPGLAISLRPSPDRSVWRLVLRSAVRFQDGTPFNAGAVLANARRWQSSPAGRRLLPDLFAVDAPRPHEVRFQFSASRSDAPELLSSPRLGIVSPGALRPRNGVRARFRPVATETGTGPFRLDSRTDTAIVLARNPQWWGTEFGLGPALDGVGFTAVPGKARRLELLRSGAVEVAQPLGGTGSDAVADDPLLRSSGSGAEAISYEASVRGLDQGSVPPLLSTVWLTTIGG